MKEHKKIYGILSAKSCLVGTITSDIPKMSVIMRKENSGVCGRIHSAADSKIQLYNGEYDIMPEADEQTLNTKDKRMVEDIKIKPIPYFEVSNNAGGVTIYVGSDI